MQVIEMSKKEKIKMYRKLKKKKLAEMLYACNLIIDSITPKIVTYETVENKKDESA